jgi:hypothetical protein
VRPAGREPHVYAPMCMCCPVRGLVCRAPKHPSRFTNPSLDGRFTMLWGWLVRARSSSTAAPVGDTHARAGSMDRTFAAARQPSRGATDWAVRPATRPSVQRAAELIYGPRACDRASIRGRVHWARGRYEGRRPRLLRWQPTGTGPCTVAVRPTQDD